MKYCSYTNNLKKYFNKYFCKYKSKTRFNRFEYSVFKRMVYKEWYFDQDDTFEDWVYRSRINLALMGYIEGSKTSRGEASPRCRATGEKLFTGFKPKHAIVIGAVRNNNQSAIKHLPILYKGGQ